MCGLMPCDSTFRRVSIADSHWSNAAGLFAFSTPSGLNPMSGWSDVAEASLVPTPKCRWLIDPKSIAREMPSSTSKIVQNAQCQKNEQNAPNNKAC